MEHVPLVPQKDQLINIIQIKKIQEIPLFSFEKINLYFKDTNILQSYCNNLLTNKKMEDLLSKSLILKVALLPRDVTCKIIKHMFQDDDETLVITDDDDKGALATKWATKFYTTPLFYAFEKYNKVRNIAQCLSPGNGLAPMLFQIPDEEYQDLAKNVEQLTSSTLSLPTPDELESNKLPIMLMSESEAEAFQSYPEKLQETLLTGKNIRVVKDNQYCIYICNPINGKLIGGLIGLGLGLYGCLTLETVSTTKTSFTAFIIVPTIFTALTTLTGYTMGMLTDTIKNRCINANTTELCINDTQI